MSSEILTVPENKLPEVIAVLRAGLAATRKSKKISRETREQLRQWCDEEAEYCLYLGLEEKD